MKEAIFQLNETLKSGLALTYNVRNRPYLVQSLGAFPFEGVLQAVRQFSRIDTSSLGTLSFPYPQLFVLQNVIIVCISTAIYEYSGGTLTLKIGSLTAGSTWQVLDYKTFLSFTNGKVAVTKNPQNGNYAVDSSLPVGNACCDYNGQALVSV